MSDRVEETFVVAEPVEVEEVELTPEGHGIDVHGIAESLHATLDQAAVDVRNAVTSGLAAAEPVFRDKVAPALADAAAKLSELTENAAKTTAERAGIAEAETPSVQIGHGLASVGAGLLGLTRSLADWVHEHASNAAEGTLKFDGFNTDPDNIGEEEELVDDDVADVADLLQQPVVVLDGDVKAVEPN